MNTQSKVSRRKMYLKTEATCDSLDYSCLDRASKPHGGPQGSLGIISQHISNY